MHGASQRSPRSLLATCTSITRTTTVRLTSRIQLTARSNLSYVCCVGAALRKPAELSCRSGHCVFAMSHHGVVANGYPGGRRIRACILPIKTIASVAHTHRRGPACRVQSSHLLQAGPSPNAVSDWTGYCTRESCRSVYIVPVGEELPPSDSCHCDLSLPANAMLSSGHGIRRGTEHASCCGAGAA